MDAAAHDPDHKTVIVHAGTYGPSKAGQAFLQFHHVHDGLVVQASGRVVLTAEAPHLAKAEMPSYPAVVNHVVYFGDGITNATVLRGFRITGANGYVDPLPNQHSFEPGLEPGLFFYLDGGAVKIFGRSYPTLEGCAIENNHTLLCGGGVSVEHRGFLEGVVQIRNCVFRRNSCPATGAAIDLLEGSAAKIENCLFVENSGNTGMDEIQRKFGLSYNARHGSGALTVFPGSSAEVVRCTFANNSNGVDDRGQGNTYHKTIFHKNTLGDGNRPGGAYEMDILDASHVVECYFHGEVEDLQGTIQHPSNVFDAPSPQFDSEFRPRADAYAGVGYRPVEQRPLGEKTEDSE